jgi:hypothetical protein
MCGIGVESAGPGWAFPAARICGNEAGIWQVPQGRNTHKIRAEPAAPGTALANLSSFGTIIS